MKRLLLILLVCLSTLRLAAEQTVFKQIELAKFLANRGIHCRETYQITHNKYEAVDETWFRENVMPRWEAFKKLNNIEYRYETTNCETLAFLFRYVAESITNVEFAVGLFNYLPDNKMNGTDGHSINIILVKNFDVVTILFFDPTSGFFVTPTKSEVRSCYFLYF